MDSGESMKDYLEAVLVLHQKYGTQGGACGSPLSLS